VAKSSLQDVAKLLKKNASTDALFSAVHKASYKHLPKNTPEDSITPLLVTTRDEAVAKIFTGSVLTKAETTEQAQSFETEQQRLLQLLSTDFVSQYLGLLASKTQQRIKQLATLYGIGVTILAEDPSVCPLCSQPLTDSIRHHVLEQHQHLLEKQGQLTTLADAEKTVTDLLNNLNQSLVLLCYKWP
jgi:NAD-specific glutamate dehydrogenase